MIHPKRKCERCGVWTTEYGSYPDFRHLPWEGFERIECGEPTRPWNYNAL